MEPLCRTLTLLLPNSTFHSISAVVTGWVRQATELVDTMAAEQALFRAFIPFYMHDDYVTLDVEYTGKKVMCTFPGFGRDFKADDRTQFVCVVKATAEGWTELSEFESQNQLEERKEYLW